MKRLNLTLLLVVVVAIATVPTTIAASPVRNVTYKGTSGVSFWSTCPWLYDPGYPAEDVAMCTNTSIFVTEDAYNEDGAQYTGSHTIFIEVQYAYVDGNLVPVRIREGSAPAETWSVERHLESATLRVVVPVQDCFTDRGVCTTGQAVVEVTWAAAGPLIRTSGGDVFKASDSLTVAHGNSLLREATADGVVDGAATGRHLVGMLFSTSGGSISMCRDTACLESP